MSALVSPLASLPGGEGNVKVKFAKAVLTVFLWELFALSEGNRA
jgi:hypothetical protein